jgi:hypothetical protein
VSKDIERFAKRRLEDANDAYEDLNSTLEKIHPGWRERHIRNKLKEGEEIDQSVMDRLKGIKRNTKARGLRS